MIYTRKWTGQKCSFRHQKELQEYANLKSSQIKHEGPLLTIDKRNYKKTLPVQDATSPNHSMQFQSHLRYLQTLDTVRDPRKQSNVDFRARNENLTLK